MALALRIALGLGTAVGVVLAFLLVAAAIFAAVFHVHVGNDIGDRTYDVRTLGELRPDYKLGIGDLRVDLRDVQLPPGETHLDARDPGVRSCTATSVTISCQSVHGAARKVTVLTHAGKRVRDPVRHCKI